MRGLQRLLVGGRGRATSRSARQFFSRCSNSAKSDDASACEVIGGLFHFVLVIDVAIRDAPRRTLGPEKVIDALDALEIHREPLEPVGDLAHHRAAVEPARLLEVGELRDFHAVQPDLPAESPGAERRRFPVAP